MSAELDAAIRLAQEANDDCRRWAGLLQEAKAERDAALAVIERARAALGRDRDGDECYPGGALVEAFRLAQHHLSTVDTSALAARDAETRRRAIYEAAVLADSLLINARNFPYVFTEGAFFIERNAAANAVPAALRALAEKGAGK